MATITKSTNLFPTELIPEVFSKVAGHSTLAKLSNQTPVPFTGTDEFVFTMDGEASIVGEGENKPAGDAGLKPVTIKPIKFIYQSRVTDEFVHMAEEKQVPYLQKFTDGFAMKMARALDIAAMHGVNPATGDACEAIASKNFDMAAVGTVTVTAGSEDDTLDAAIQTIVASDGAITGIAMSPSFGSDLGKIKVNGVVQYPEFRFGGNPSTFAGIPSNVNSTVSFKTSKDLAIVGDFANVFKWGYAENIPLEIIEYGDPDGLGDLKRTNQVCLRAEAYIGWGILDADSFKKIVKVEG